MSNSYFAEKTPVSHWQRNEWIATFVVGLALLIVRFAVYTLAKYEDPTKRTTVATTETPTTSTHHHYHHHNDGSVEPLSSYVTMGIPINTIPHHDINSTGSLTTTTRTAKPSSFRFSRGGLQSCSNIFLFGFVLLLANAAFSGTMGYVSRSTMALCK